MAFPVGWPGRAPSGARTIRFYVTGTSTANFLDNGFLFVDGTGANPYVALPDLAPGGERTNIVLPPIPLGATASKLNADPDPLGRSAPPPKTMIWSRAIRIVTTAAVALEYSFDGTNVHGIVPASSERLYLDRFECGISVKGSGGTGTFYIEAW